MELQKIVLVLSIVCAGLTDLVAGQSMRCSERCGESDIDFPFGIEPGCGDPEHLLRCVSSPTGNRLELPLSSLGAAVDVLKINYTTQTMLVNTTGNPLYYSSDCEADLDAEAYDVRREDNYGCLVNITTYGVSQLPDMFRSLHFPTCSFRVGGEIPTPFPLPSSLVARCFNYTRQKNTAGSVDPWVLTYATLPWKVKPDWQQECEGCTGICGYITSDIESFQCYPRSPPRNSSASSSHSTKTIGAVAGALGGALLLVLCLGGCFIYRRRLEINRRRKIILDDSSVTSKPAKFDSSMGSSQYLSSPNVYDHLRSNSNSGHGYNSRFTLGELQEATDNFSEAGLLGDGGFGTVYKGTLRDGRLVAVKKLNPWNAQGKSQFQNEVNILSQVTHPNLVRLYGCCSESREHLLVYEFIASGTLSDHIHDNRGGFMEWDKRLIVVLETAEALAWLHNTLNPPIFHRDVKSTNILIDENYHAKVGDFGLSRLVPSLELTHVTTAPQGTPGYLDPDYHQSYQLTDKSDVYSFGVVLMEIVSSQRAVDMSRDRKEINLAALAVSRIQCGHLEKLIDPRLETEFDPVRKRMVEGVAEVGFECLAAEKDDRPCMLTVAQKLRGIYEEGKQRYLEQMVKIQQASRMESFKRMSRGGFVASQESPTSVQNLWFSNHTSPNDSNSSM